MKADALQFFKDLADVAKAPVQLKEAASPAELVYVIGGKIASVPIPPKPREHEVQSLADLIALAARFDAIDGPSPVVWFNEAAVVLVIEDAGHRADTVTLALVASDVWETIIKLRQSADWIDQKAMVKLLRIDLGPKTIPPVVLLEPLRRLKFDGNTGAVQTVSNQRESISKTILAEVKTEDGGDLPEVVTLHSRVYITQGETDKFAIDCSVEVDAMRGLFRLRPLPDEVERVGQLAVESIRERLAEGLPASVPAFFGKP